MIVIIDIFATTVGFVYAVNIVTPTREVDARMDIDLSRNYQLCYLNDK